MTVGDNGEGMSGFAGGCERCPRGNEISQMPQGMYSVAAGPSGDKSPLSFADYAEAGANDRRVDSEAPGEQEIQALREFAREEGLMLDAKGVRNLIKSEPTSP